jgi:hypothetical protein
MLHKRYNYKRPLTLVVIFFALCIRTNSIVQGNNERTDAIAKTYFAENRTQRMVPNNNYYFEKSFLYTLYNRLILQFHN